MKGDLDLNIANSAIYLCYSTSNIFIELDIDYSDHTSYAIFLNLRQEANRGRFANLFDRLNAFSTDESDSYNELGVER